MKEWTREERYRTLKDPQELWDMHEEVRTSDYRQQFHIQSITGLINDPNGFVRHNESWHLFYQWCPWGAVHGLKYWYHVVSKDLVNWKNLGICLMPDREYDNKGVYSGSAMPIGEDLYLYYTGNHRDEDWTRHAYTCLARLKKDGWLEKYPLPLFGENKNYTEHQRDPKITYIKELDTYYIMIGAQTKKHYGCALVYSSKDLLHGWNFVGELKVPGFEKFGDMWECPCIERIGEQDVLIFCPQHLLLPGRGQSDNHNGYILGTMDWENLTFTPDGSFHVLDFGFDSYAAACANNVNRDNHAVLIAWMGLPDVTYPTDEENWSGCLTLPRELSVRDRRLIQRPISGLKELREKEIELSDYQSGTVIDLPRVCEMELYFRPGDVSLQLFADKNGNGGLSITYSELLKEIMIDRGGMKTTFNEAHGLTRTRTLPNGLKHLRIFIDRSSVEIFVNDGDAVFTSRIFPADGEAFTKVTGDVYVRMWPLKAACEDLLIV
ncbi:MAG: sucrose-6-phosphate hydrolase [Lachnospiraceae bacterium]|nr:sucrose-6-phosphate hydrolase [Lachnospiraceae bacterium]